MGQSDFGDQWGVASQLMGLSYCGQEGLSVPSHSLQVVLMILSA